MKTVLKNSLTLFAGCLAAAFVFYLRKPSDPGSSGDLYGAVCDAFAVPGILLCSAAFFRAAADTGAYTGLSHALSYTAGLFFPGISRRTVQIHRPSLRGKHNAIRLFRVGLLFMAVSLTFLILYCTAESG